MINKYEISKNDLDQDIENIKGRYNAIIDYLFYIENCLIDSNKESWELEKELNQVKEENKKLKKELSDLENIKHELYLDYMELDNIFDITYNELNQVKEENKKLKKELSDLEIKNHKLIKEIDYLNDYINDLEKYN